MFLAARSARPASGSGSGTSSRLPKAMRMPGEVQPFDRSRLAAISISHVSTADHASAFISVIMVFPPRVAKRASMNWSGVRLDHSVTPFR